MMRGVLRRRFVDLKTQERVGVVPRCPETLAETETESGHRKDILQVSVAERPRHNDVRGFDDGTMGLGYQRRSLPKGGLPVLVTKSPHLPRTITAPTSCECRCLTTQEIKC